jgi:hypothetical protein
MPALFAYLITVGILLGGGYGALNWLAAPEPVKMVANAKQKPPLTHAATVSAPASAQVSPPQAVDTAAKQATNDKPKSTEPEPRVAAREQGASNDEAKPTSDQQDTGHAETAPAEARQSPPHRESVVEDRQPKEEYRQQSKQESKQQSKQENKRLVDVAPTMNNASNVAPAPIAKPKRPSQRQASQYSEKDGLALMRLRTIEFPDGRRITQLIPYRDDRRYREGRDEYRDDRRYSDDLDDHRAIAFGPGFGLGW